MKRLVIILFILASLASCEKYSYPGWTPGKPDTIFTTKILDNYFVTSIAFDSKGNAWIGTFRQGLIRYRDGQTEVFNSRNSVIASDEVINDIAVDSHDNVWIGCNGLLKYDGTSLRRFDSSNSPIPEDFVGSVAIDSKDNVWFTSCRFREGGLVRYDDNSWTVYTPDNSELPVNLIESVAVDSKDNIWLALSEVVGRTYLVKIKGSSWEKYTSDDLGFVPYYFGDIDFNSRDQLCGAIDYSLSSLWVHPGPQVFVFDGEDTRQFRISDMTRVWSLMVDDDDNIWCAVDGGFAVFNGEKWTIEDSAFTDESVFTIEQSDDGTIWLGTSDGIFINR
ncbi:MAG: two-component regulator propeller domain-containing protein [Bacteroidales bacterium]